ncbi:MAG: chromate efflux transporter [Alphaproteobacteria bacterium]|nr:chromate efflux transporter [Alphaproteobacteria bacterium]
MSEESNPNPSVENRDIEANAGIAPVPFGEAVRTWARVAALSFGGPAGQIAVMHRILVEEKRWIGETRFLHALNYCMLLPGPEAHELAIYIGWLLHRVRGGLIAGVLFVLPGLVALTALSLIYAKFGHVGAVQALFFGLKAAVLAVVLEAVMRVGKRALKNRGLVLIAALAFVAIFAFAVPFPLIVLGAALIGYLGNRAGLAWFKSGGGHGAARGETGPPAHIDAVFARGVPEHLRPSLGRLLKAVLIGGAIWLGPLVLLALTLGPNNVFTAIAAFNSKMAVVTFGGAYAVLAYMAQQAVEYYHWLKPGEMLVGLGFAETTPGPLISVVQFVGFMAAFRDPGVLTPTMAGILGGALAMWSTFVPPFIWVFAGGPYVEALIGNRALNAALSAVTAAVVGVILNLAVWFALHTLFAHMHPVHAFGLSLDLPVWSSVNWAAVLIAAAAMVAILRFKAGMIPVLAASCLAGLGFYFASGHI